MSGDLVRRAEGGAQPLKPPSAGPPIQPAAMTAAQVDLVKRTIAKGATDDELQLFLYIAGRLALDPFTHQIHFVKRKRQNEEGGWEDVGETQVGIDGYRVLAQRTGRLSGTKRAVIHNDAGELTGAWTEIYRSDWNEPVREEVSLEEYIQKRRDGKPVKMWREKPETMLKKCSEAAALRIAFPNDLGAIGVDEAITAEDVDNLPPDLAGVTPPPGNAAPPAATPTGRPPNNPLTEEHLARIRELVAAKRMDAGHLTVELKTHYACESLADLTDPQGERLVVWLERLPVPDTDGVIEGADRS